MTEEHVEESILAELGDGDAYKGRQIARLLTYYSVESLEWAFSYPPLRAFLDAHPDDGPSDEADALIREALRAMPPEMAARLRAYYQLAVRRFGPPPLDE